MVFTWLWVLSQATCEGKRKRCRRERDCRFEAGLIYDKNDCLGVYHAITSEQTARFKAPERPPDQQNEQHTRLARSSDQQATLGEAMNSVYTSHYATDCIEGAQR